MIRAGHSPYFEQAATFNVLVDAFLAPPALRSHGVASVWIAFPRVRLGHLPTPLEPMARLSAHLGGDALDQARRLHGLATGGNKTRKLEFLVADALAQGADNADHPGALQSNHARQTAAAAAKLGLKCVLVLEEARLAATDAYRHNGNVLLDHLLGATVKYVPRDSSMTAASEMAADEVRRGRRPTLCHSWRGSNAIGTLGYVAARWKSCSRRRGSASDRPRRAATGSSGTQAGLIAGFDGMRTACACWAHGRPATRQPGKERRSPARRDVGASRMTGAAAHDNIEATTIFRRSLRIRPRP